MKGVLAGFVAILALTLAVTTGHTAGLRVGYYEMEAGEGVAFQVPPIEASGNIAVKLVDLSQGELARIDVLFLTNGSNDEYSGEFLGALGRIESWVADGGILIFHDRFVDPAEMVLPGGETFDIVRDFSEDREIDVRDGSTLVTNGPGGVIDDDTLDDGSSSNHGFAIYGSLPKRDGEFILSTSDPDHIVTFSYCFEDGGVIYSSIPLDFYLDGSGPDDVREAMTEIYAVNVVAYATDSSFLCLGAAETNRPNLGGALSGLFAGQPTPLPGTQSGAIAPSGTGSSSAATRTPASTVISPPNTGDAGLASSSSNAMLFVIVGAAAFVLAGIASVSYARR